MNVQLQLITTIFLSLVLIFWVVFPLFRAVLAPSATQKDELAEERLHSIYKSLGALYASKDADSVAEDDFHNIEHRLILEAAKILHSLGVDPTPSKKNGKKADPGKARFCAKCGGKRQPEFQFCPMCGSGYRAA